MIALAALASCASYPVPPDQSLVEAAEAATVRGDWPAAADYWGRAIAEVGDVDPRPHLEAARAQLALHKTETAQLLLDRGIERFPEDVELRLMSGALLCEQGYRRAAEQNYQVVVREAPEHAEAWLLLATVQLDLDLPANAAVAINRYMELAGADTRAMYLFALVCAKNGRLSEAMESFAKAFDKTDVPIEHLIAAANVLTEGRHADADLRSLKQACEWVERALERDPQNAEASYVRGMILEIIGDDPAAVEAYERAVELVNHLLAMTRLAQVYARLGELDRADEMIDRALELNVHASHRRRLERVRQAWH